MASTANPYRLTLNGTYIVPSAAGLMQGLGWSLLLAASLNFNLGVMLMLTLLLAAVALVCMVETVRNLAGIEVEVLAPPPFAAGTAAPFQVRLRALDGRARPGLQLGLVPWDPRAGWRARIGLGPLRHAAAIDLPPEGRTVEIWLAAESRGRLGPVRLLLASTWPLGLFRAWRGWTPELAGVVHPEALAAPASRTPDAPEAAGGTPADAAPLMATASGDGTGDFNGHRRRHAADPLRHIDWRASLRAGAFLVARRDPAATSGPVSLRWQDHAPAAAEFRLARLSHEVLAVARTGRPFLLELPGTLLPEGSGPQQRDRALQLLAEFPGTSDAGHPDAPPSARLMQPPPEPGPPASPVLPPPEMLWRWTVTLTLAALPLASQLPANAWLPWLALLATRLLLLRLGSPPPATLWLSAGALLGAAWIYSRYHTLVGRESGMALLLVMAGLKLLEVRRERDLHMLSVLALFLLLSAHFQSQAPWLALWDLAICGLLIDSLLAAHQRPVPPPRRRTLTRMITLALPLAVLLFLFLPRPESAFWGIGRSDEGLTGGLSDHMTPGSISKLRLSDRVAFRVQFNGAWPLASQMYWRGPVLDHFDGQTWSASGLTGFPPNARTGGRVIDYHYEAEDDNSGWIFALEVPEGTDGELHLDSEAVTRTGLNAHHQHSWQLRAHLDSRLDPDIGPPTLDMDLEVPEGNPQTRELASAWRMLAPRARIRAAEKALLEAHLQYSLDVPELMADPVDDLLFRSRVGYCEHFASAFALMLRVAGVPARVVTGYQGGERNPLGDYLIVRQQDAHAWVEAWIAGEGWLRIDPTALAVPALLTGGTQAAAPLPAPAWMPGFARASLPLWHRLGLLRDMAAMRWQRDVADLNAREQKALLAELGLGNLSKGTLVAACALLISGALGIQLALAARRRPARSLRRAVRDGGGEHHGPLDRSAHLLRQRTEHARARWQDDWESGCRLLGRLGLARGPEEGPKSYRERLARAVPSLAPALADWADPCLLGMYGNDRQVPPRSIARRLGGPLAALALVALGQQLRSVLGGRRLDAG